ncbi:MAG: secondary thiamine-phosphate synthase enzyme YjbQ [Elusimicrobia bacterium]|nr:secondary thiamine-phosphate synthase enzyme YjbQ [Elusimicrobiota bacterium]
MKIHSVRIHLSTRGNTEITNITGTVQKELDRSDLSDGIVTVFVPGATGSITTMEYEPGLIKDTTNIFRQLVDDTATYSHDASHTVGNASSHLRATLVGPSLVVPFENRKLSLGTWQQIVFIDFDNRPRKREIILKFLGL